MSKEIWFNKLSSLSPSWVFNDLKNSKSVYMAISACLSKVEDNIDSHISQTYIDSSDSSYLDVHGYERNKKRSNDETDSSYSRRIKNISNSSNLKDIKGIVDSFLVRGESTVVNSDGSDNFLNRGSFLNRNVIESDISYNSFTILVYHQIPAPSSFLDNNLFCDRSFLAGALNSDINIFTNIINSINKEKAYGTVYRLIERFSEE